MKRYFLLMTVVAMATLCGMAQTQTKYELYVADIQVTSDNASNITGDGITKGKISYDPNSKTLTLDNAVIYDSDFKCGIENKGVDGLTIKLIGENTINTANLAGMMIKANTQITGEGCILTSESDMFMGIQVDYNTTLTIKDGCCVVAKGNFAGIGGVLGKNEEKLVVNNATVKATSNSDGASISRLAGLVLENCKITQPLGAFFNSEAHYVEFDGKKVTEQVIIQPGSNAPVKYGIKIAGIDVTSDNSSNITGEGISGKVRYNDKNKTLTLEDATIIAPNTPKENTGISNISITDLKINIVGTNSVEADWYGIDLAGNTTIEGNGELKVTSKNNYGIFINKNVTLTFGEKNTTEVTGKAGIAGYDGANKEALIVNNATVKATGNTEGSIINIEILTLNDCQITQPQGAALNNSTHKVELAGNAVKEQIVIEHVKTGINTATSDNNIVVYGGEGVVYINSQKPLNTVKVYSLSGILVRSVATTSTTAEIQLPQGVYFINVGGSSVKTLVY